MKFKRGDLVREIKGSQWRGFVVGSYSTMLTPEGYCVESRFEPGSVHIYPAAALEWDYGKPFQCKHSYREDSTVCEICGA